MKILDFLKEMYMAETIDQLVEMLKQDNYEVTLNIKKKGKIKKHIVKL